MNCAFTRLPRRKKMSAKTMAMLGVLAVLLVLLIWTAACDRSADNQCRTFSASGGSFDPLEWEAKDADKLCEHLGMKRYWGEVKDTAIQRGTDTSYYITQLTCCTR